MARRDWFVWKEMRTGTRHGIRAVTGRALPRNASGRGGDVANSFVSAREHRLGHPHSRGNFGKL